MKGLVFGVTMIVLSLIMATGAVVFGQTNTPSPTISPTTTTTTTPTPTSATVPSGAPSTGMGGN